MQVRYGTAYLVQSLPPRPLSSNKKSKLTAHYNLPEGPKHSKGSTLLAPISAHSLSSPTRLASHPCQQLPHRPHLVPFPTGRFSGPTLVLLRLFGSAPLAAPTNTAPSLSLSFVCSIVTWWRHWYVQKNVAGRLRTAQRPLIPSAHQFTRLPLPRASDQNFRTIAYRFQDQRRIKICL